MAVSAELLGQIHRLHQQLADLRERLDRGPRQIRAHEANVADMQSKAAAAADAVQRSKLAADTKQLDLKSSEMKINDWKAKLNVCNSNKEFHSLQEQIAAAEMANSVLADEILEILEKIDQLQAAGRETASHVELGKNELAKRRDEVAAEAVVIRDEIVRLEADLAEAEKQLPVDFRDDYRRVINSKGADGMSKVDGMACEGCGQNITLNMQNELLLSKPVFCRGCGRLLYGAEL